MKNLTESIEIQEIYVQQNIVYCQLRLSPGVKRYFTTDKLFIEYDHDVSAIPLSILVIPFVGSIVALSWLINCVFWVKEIDSTYYNSLKQLKVAYQELYPHYKLGGRFVAAYLRENQISHPQSNSALLLFSGGLDAHTSYIRNKHKKLLLCNIQGWLKNPGDENNAQKADFKDINEFASREGVNSTFVKSNFATIIDNYNFQKHIGKKLKGTWWHEFQHSMAFISIAIPIAFEKSIPEIIIASSHFIGSSGLCASYPTTDNEFKFAGSGKTLHDGFELTRQDKTRIVVKHQLSSNKPYPIRVCSFNDHNCCVCTKCFRTIIAIISEGGDIKNFGFNINENLTKYYTDYLKHGYIYFGINRDSKLFWPDTKRSIKANYSKIKEKEFVDWFMTTDFIKERKRAVLRYRLKNFFPLLIKRIKQR